MRKTPVGKLENDPLLASAIEWFIELRQPNVTPERVVEWQNWLAAAEAHREAFAHVEKLWALPRQLHAIPWPTDVDVAADGYDGTTSVSSWRAGAFQGAPRAVSGRLSANRRRLLLRALAASLAAGLITVLTWSGYRTWPQWSARLRASEPVVLETVAGERQQITLPDDSRIDASGHTRLSATLSDGARSIILEQGEAFFEVAKDSSRPFTVKAGDTAITAVGTAFNVRRARERVVVAVAEGQVRVEAPSPPASATAPRLA
ncbi:MAG: FecR family protein, partial [Steroidobacteraceae bacterium]